MTKGKHAVASALRREREAKSLAGGLKLEIKILKSQLSTRSTSQEAHEQTLQELDRVRTQLEDGTSDEVESLKAVIADLKVSVKALEGKDVHRKKVWSKAVENMVYHFTEVHNLTQLEALEVLVELIGEEASTIVDHDHQKRMSPRWIRAMQAKTGVRRGIRTTPGDEL
jgi:hypothetical protein